MIRVVLILLIVLLMFSCQSDERFYWGDYEKIILEFNQNSSNMPAIQKSMRNLVGKAQRRKKVPPGIYAEYGYILMEVNQFKRAAYYFQQEKKLWPDSKKLMDISIKRAKILHDTQK